LTDGVPEGAAVGGAPPPRPFGALLLARLAGEAGLGWLGQEPAALCALAAYFGDGPSELRAIAEEAERRIGLPLHRGPAVSAPAAPPAEEAAADPPDAPQPQAASAEPAPERTPPPAIGGEGAGWEWVNWVRRGLRDGSVPVNTPGAWLHNIEGEAYVVAPACFEAFAAGRDLAPVTVRHRVVRLRRHRSRASRSGAANLFRAVLADGSRVEGMVFPGELVWDDDPPPRANASLVGKGR
ncbi:MAG: DNA-binding domain-containing protein, partial [Immundisolibacterales bacterium]|nr:DNA-binding domain-containing protein [Immundisolibacterales bacterium]